MSGVTLSAVVCAHNEEARLEACLRRLAFADEIVVLLDRCTDGSQAIAERLANKVVIGAFPLEGPRRAAAVAAASGAWILEVDADEAISPALAEEIRQRVAAPGQADYFQIPVDNYVGRRLVRYGWGGSFGTSSVSRLFRAGIKTWGDEQVHPTTRFAGVRGPSLTNPLEHDVDRDVTDMLHRFDRYTALRAQDLAVRPKGGVLSNLFRAVRRFWKCYVSRKGYREGDWGFLIALLAALYPLVSTLRARLEREMAAPAGKA
ncbi:glycosyltransferase family 2 protein [Caulobacter segnis]|uniref:glycosyltransferase family 2 protein n=1 Tax=Caulobacter segnis TaxID=88688 RepID=UPI002410AC83|nr:glycosyltransferase family 2 protein [Caulobacter segnis]MDG2520403.1 glycosyltransferase family 2 protein [Caulobacter segnis]